MPALGGIALEEVRPWIEVLLRLYEDEAFYREQSERSRLAAQAWLPERLLAQYDAFFRGLLTAR